jgi:uncharacterized membrane protein
MTSHTRYLAEAALIAALYVVLTSVAGPFSYGPVQCRLSETLTVLPLLTSAAIPGLFCGCILANLVGPYGLLDIVFGSLCTLIAALGTWYCRKMPFPALLFPVLVNALGVGFYLYVLSRVPFLLTLFSVGAGEALVVFGPGLVLYLALRKVPYFEGMGMDGGE